MRILVVVIAVVPALGACDGDVAPEHMTCRELGDWLHARAVRVRDGLLRAGYPVHGDPDRLLPVERAGVPGPSDAGVLALALRLLLEKR